MFTHALLAAADWTPWLVAAAVAVVLGGVILACRRIAAAFATALEDVASRGD